MPQAINSIFANIGLGSGMARILILLVIAAMTYTVIMSGPSGVTMPIDPAVVAADANPAPAASSLPGLDLVSLAIGLVAGFLMGWIWQLPWRTVPELFREVVFRSIRGVGIIGLAMGAAAILLFY